MGKIFCIIGKSSSGKDTIANILFETTDLKPIILYTTRPIRSGEVDGVSYYFVTDDVLSHMENQGKIIEKRIYDTVYGPWTYATVDSNIDLENNNYLTLNTLEGYEKLVSYYERDVVVPIYIWIDWETRLDRAFYREEKQENPKYKELCRRFISDEIDFSEENLINLEIYDDVRYLNDDLDACIDRIKETIAREIENQNVQKKTALSKTG